MKRILILIVTLVLLAGCAQEAIEAEGWGQALLGADFAQSRMVGDTLKGYVRADNNGRSYELFVTYEFFDDLFPFGGYETWVFVSEVQNEVPHYVDSFKVEMGQGAATGGIGAITFGDINFDGQDDVLIWLGHFGA